ncbi:two-component sensor histidine kinase [Yoonia maritima]|uniref:histidine kinase n=1 Tax=Yoonia maritima TaxID=1435347 RepID=A0A2T0VY57_9RHOB|nr:sensor histidine kinase [Yoonia maritima]PRY77191.1 two-component sensor histidine kinase [Yoonia maritima]
MMNVLRAARSALDKLGVRFAVVLAVALLPLTIVSVLRSQSVISEARSQSEAALDGETLRVVSRELALIEEAKGAAIALAEVIPQLMANPESCMTSMKRIVDAQPFSFAGYYDLTGYIACSNADAPFSIGLTEDLKAQISDPRTTVLVNRDAPVSGTSVLYATSPMYNEDTEELTGFAAVSVPHQALAAASEKFTGNVAFLTLNWDGQILTSTMPLDRADQVLPIDGEIIDYLGRLEPFTRKDRTGVLRTYSVVPILNGQIYALGTWPEASISKNNFYMSSPGMFPALMWLASLAVAWFASSLLVTGHVLRLRNAMRSFTQDRSPTDIASFRNAPQELREVAQAHADMTDQLMRDEALLEDTVRQKEVLLREVHHRVKNNLQLIASIMNMQMRGSKSPEVHQLMRGLHDRVISLATIHRGLYQTTGLADVRVDELLAEIVQQVVRIGAVDHKAIEVKTQLDELHLNPDQAVPLSLMVTEALTNALKYIGAQEGQQPKLTVELRSLDGDMAEVLVKNTLPSVVAPPEKIESTGLGSQLLEAFCQQLYGEMEKSDDGKWFTVKVGFPVEELTPKPGE